MICSKCGHDSAFNVADDASEIHIGEVYCDGGVIGCNPSELGGTWSFVVPGCPIVSGVVTPREAGLPKITNNYTELLAAVQALENMPAGWAGTIYTDSQITLFRIRNQKPKFNGIPQDLQQRVWAARKRLGNYQVVLVGGHPTQNDLALGQDSRGLPVSKWNVECDKECTRLSKLHRR